MSLFPVKPKYQSLSQMLQRPPHPKHPPAELPKSSSNIPKTLINTNKMALTQRVLSVCRRWWRRFTGAEEWHADTEEREGLLKKAGTRRPHAVPLYKEWVSVCGLVLLPVPGSRLVLGDHSLAQVCHVPEGRGPGPGGAQGRGMSEARRGQAQRCQRTVLGTGTAQSTRPNQIPPPHNPCPPPPPPPPPPPAQNSTVLVRAECGAAWEGRQGAEAAVVSRGTTVPLSRSKVVYAERRWVHEGWWATQCHVFCVLPCVWVEMSCGVGIWGGEELCECAGGACREG